jgi:hypothetical protein
VVKKDWQEKAAESELTTDSDDTGGLGKLVSEGTRIETWNLELGSLGPSFLVV